MRRTVILSAAAALIIALAAVPATAGQPAAPRGVLTNVEYQELLAVQKAEKHRVKGRTFAQVVGNLCKPLTQASRITSTQHAECIAAEYFFVRLYGFTTKLAHCEKNPAKGVRLNCGVGIIDALKRATRNFISADAASARAARARGITGKCLDYLILTPRQAVPMHQLAPALSSFVSALRAGNATRLATASVRLTEVLDTTLKVFTGGSVTVCRHQ